MSTPQALFVVLGEEEVPAFRTIADGLRKQGIATRVVTWLERLAGPDVEALSRSTAMPLPARELNETLARAGFADASMAADYDRDWHFATVGRKRRHVARVAAALEPVLREHRPTHLISAVGGETTRMVADALAQAAGITRLYFNALPLDGRFALLPSLDAPFVAWEDDGRPRPASSAADAPERSGATLDEPGLLAQGLARSRQLAAAPQQYPPSWLPRRVATTLRHRALSGPLRPRARPDGAGDEISVLYPLHDERDFQVALRERHAVPQEHLLLYLSSTLPPGHRLFVKPHPQHQADHHPLLWRRLRARPNVTFLPPDQPASEAIDAADVVLTLASSLGFEALLRETPVVVYGRPFYSRRGLTVDVEDPRALAPAIRDAVGTIPDPAGLDALIALMHRSSWAGRFTPLDLAPANLERLQDALQEVLGA